MYRAPTVRKSGWLLLLAWWAAFPRGKNDDSKSGCRGVWADGLGDRAGGGCGGGWNRGARREVGVGGQRDEGDWEETRSFGGEGGDRRRRRRGKSGAGGGGDLHSL